MGREEMRMKRRVFLFSGVFFIVSLAIAGWSRPPQTGDIKLAPPAYDGKVSVERAIRERRTVRNFRPTFLNADNLAQLLWAAQGITDEQRGLRSAPSAGARYPLDVYAVVGDGGVEGVNAGVYRYHPLGHALELVMKGDRRQDVAHAALGQTWVAGAPVVFVITAEYERITQKYADRGIRYAIMEAGHAGENIFLQAGALGLGAGIVGAFRDESVVEAIGAPKVSKPLIIIPVGYRR